MAAKEPGINWGDLFPGASVDGSGEDGAIPAPAPVPFDAQTLWAATGYDARASYRLMASTYAQTVELMILAGSSPVDARFAALWVLFGVTWPRGLGGGR